MYHVVRSVFLPGFYRQVHRGMVHIERVCLDVIDLEVHRIHVRRHFHNFLKHFRFRADIAATARRAHVSTHRIKVADVATGQPETDADGLCLRIVVAELVYLSEYQRMRTGYDLTLPVMPGISQKPPVADRLVNEDSVV